MQKFYKILFLFFVFLFSAGNIYAKDIYVNEGVNASGDCLTENTACKSIVDAMVKAEDGDNINLLSSITEANGGQDLALKGVTINGNNHKFTIRGVDLSLSGDLTFRNITLSFLSDGAGNFQKIFMNLNNLTLNSVTINEPTGGENLPIIVAGSKQNTASILNEFSLNIDDNSNLKLKEIITSGLDGVFVPVNVNIGEKTKIETVKSTGEKSGLVFSKTKDPRFLNFQNLLKVTLENINLSNQIFSNVETLELKNNTNINPMSLSVLNIFMEKGTILALTSDIGELNLETLQTLGSGNSQERPKIILTEENKLIVDRIADTEFFFSAHTRPTDEEKVFVLAPQNSKDLVKGEIIGHGDNERNFSELGEEGNKVKFGLPAKEKNNVVDKSELERVIAEYEALPEEIRIKIELRIFNDAVAEKFNNNSTEATVKEKTEALKNAIEKAKNPDLQNAKNNAKNEIDTLEHLDENQKRAYKEEVNLAQNLDEVNQALADAKRDNEILKKQKEQIKAKKEELRKLLDKATLPETIEGKIQATVTALVTQTQNSERDYNFEQITLDALNKSIEDLKKALDSLKTDKAPLIAKIGEYENFPNYLKNDAEVSEKIAKIRELNNLENPEVADLKNSLKNFETAVLNATKKELKRLLDLANNSSTTNGKTTETVNNLNTKKAEAQKVYDNPNSSLENLKAEISKLDEAIKNLKNNPASSSGSSSSSSSSGGGGGGSSSSSSSSSSSRGGGGGGSYSSNTTKISKNTEPKKDEKIEKKEETKKEEKVEKTEDKYEKIRKHFAEKGKEFKTKNIGGKEKLYTVSQKYNSCQTIPNIVGDFASDYKMIFSDVNSKNNLDEIQRLAKVGIVKGTSPTTFEPNRGITRAEFLAIVLRSHCYDVSQTPENLPFYDVDLNSWQARVIKVANEIGIIKGYEKDKKGIPFKPNKTISKIEAFAIMKRINELEIQEDYKDRYTDKKTDWQANTLSTLEYLGIINPEKTDFKFHPNSALTRDEMVKTIVDIIRLY